MQKNLVFSLAIILFSTNLLFAETITVYGLEAMPYCGTENGVPVGLVIEILNEATNHGAPKFNFKFDIPWKRAQLLVTNQKDELSAIIPFSFSEERKDKFKWISLLLKRDFQIFNLTKNKSIKSVIDAKNMSLGIVRGHVLEQVLKDLDFKKIDNTVENAKKNAMKLSLERVEAIADSDLIAIYNWEKIGKTRAELQDGPIIGSGNMIYIASGKDFPDAIANKINSAIEKMKTDGTMNQLIKKWIK
jgi:polar amino acid transport system substrate-binding protein